MLLAIEVGNTNTKIGLFDGARLLVSWRLTTRREQTADEFGVFIETLLRTRGIGSQEVQGIAISNVVPPSGRRSGGCARRTSASHPSRWSPARTAGSSWPSTTPARWGRTAW